MASLLLSVSSDWGRSPDPTPGGQATDYHPKCQFTTSIRRVIAQPASRCVLLHDASRLGSRVRFSDGDRPSRARECAASIRGRDSHRCDEHRRRCSSDTSSDRHRCHTIDVTACPRCQRSASRRAAQASRPGHNRTVRARIPVPQERSMSSPWIAADGTPGRSRRWLREEPGRSGGARSAGRAARDQS